MKGSGAIARILTALAAIPVTPVALLLISTGGAWWAIWAAEYAPGSSGPPAQVLAGVPLQIVGVLLLALVALSGIWSSAGVITAGVVALLALVFAVMPGWLVAVYPSLSRVLPEYALDGLLAGVPLAGGAAMLGAGTAIALRRRSAARVHPVLQCVLLVAVPAAVLLGLWLLALGVGRGQLQAMQYLMLLDGTRDPTGPLFSVLGVLLVAGGVLLARWSPFALLLPAILLVLGSVLSVLPATIGLLAPLFPGRATLPGTAFFRIGGGTLLGVVLLVVLVVLRVLAARAKRTGAAARGDDPFPARPGQSLPAPAPMPRPSVLPGSPYPDPIRPSGR